MEIKSDNLELLEKKIDAIKVKQLKRNIVLTSIPILVGIAWIFFSVTQVQKLQLEKDELEKEKEEIIRSTQKFQQKLDSINNIMNFVLPISFGDLKLFYSNEHGIGKIVSDMYEAKTKNATFSITGKGNNKYNSPSFMSTILLTNNLTDQIYYSANGFIQSLPDSEKLMNGDLIFYEGGYVMLYFESYSTATHTEVKACIGMTIFGILVLDPEFAKRIAIKKVPGLGFY